MKKTETKYTKEQLINSDVFSNKRDLLTALLIDGENYTVKETDELIGRAGIEIRNIDGADKNELAYIIRKDYRRKGYGYEVCKAILNYAFTKLSMDEVMIVIEKDNVPSINMADRIGATPIALSAVNGCEYMIFQCRNN